MYNCLCNDTRLTFEPNQKLPLKKANLHSIYSFLDLEAGVFMQSDWRSQSNRSMMVTATPEIQKFIMIQSFHFILYSIIKSLMLLKILHELLRIKLIRK